MKLTDEYLDEMAQHLVPILSDCAKQQLPAPKDGNRHEQTRAEIRAKVEEDPDFWKRAATSTKRRITSAKRSTQ